jgi:hypothetical protein
VARAAVPPLAHPSKAKWRYIAADVGVFRTSNRGTTWLKVGKNLPLVPVNHKLSENGRRA